MNKFKKTLALALCAIMLIAVSVIGAGAVSFTDADEIDNLEAVEMLVAIGVIDGMDDGSFDPEGSVTRAQMAKMIYIIVNGGVDSDELEASGEYFTDVEADHWAAGYIESCVDSGLISGYGDGTFGPSDTVTGIQAAKLVLIAIGYDAEYSSFTGEYWAENIGDAADVAGIWDDIDDIDTSAALTRMNAVQMIATTINIPMIEYNFNYVLASASDLDLVDVVVDGTTKSASVGAYADGRTLLSTAFDCAGTSVGIMTEIFYDGSSNYYYSFEQGISDSSAFSMSTAKTGDDYSDLYMLEVNTMFSSNGSVICMYSTSDIMYSATVSEFDADEYDLAGDTDDIAVYLVSSGVYTDGTLQLLLDNADNADMSMRLVDYDGDGSGDIVVVEAD